MQILVSTLWGFSMRVILKSTFLLTLSIALSGCGDADRKNDQAGRKTSPSTATKSITAADSSKQKTVNSASISGGKYVASLEGMT
jgi:hypothetical protein